MLHRKRQMFTFKQNFAQFISFINYRRANIFSVFNTDNNLKKPKYSDVVYWYVNYLNH